MSAFWAFALPYLLGVGMGGLAVFFLLAELEVRERRRR